jgi:hypothetical protein
MQPSLMLSVIFEQCSPLQATGGKQPGPAMHSPVHDRSSGLHKPASATNHAAVRWLVIYMLSNCRPGQGPAASLPSGPWGDARQAPCQHALKTLKASLTPGPTAASAAAQSATDFRGPGLAAASPATSPTGKRATRRQRSRPQQCMVRRQTAPHRSRRLRSACSRRTPAYQRPDEIYP